MSAGDQFPSDRQVVVPMSWEEYERLDPDVRHEYISGCLVVNPRPSYRHQAMLHNLTAALRAVVPSEYVAINEWAWKPGSDEWAPDVMVCDRDDDAVRFIGIPQLVVEVLSTDRADDLVRKLYRYAPAGLPRYWIADPLEPSVRAFVLRDGIYEASTAAAGDDDVEFEFDLGVAHVRLRPSSLLV